MQGQEAMHPAIRRIVEDRNLRTAFSAEVEAEVAALLAAPGIDDPTLVDLTAVPFVTIDDERSRDLDQAVVVDRLDGGFQVSYALADASFYVRPGSALFAEALQRGASYYLPGTMVPMLPRALSEGLISLNPSADRRATVFRMRLDRRGRCTKTAVVRGRVRSRFKLSFDGVQAFLDDPNRNGLGDPAVEESMRSLREVGLLRIRDAEDRDVVRYRRDEVEVRLGGSDGTTFVMTGSLRADVERYNEQVSLLCNVEGAKILERGDSANDAVQPIYRVHPPPTAERVTELEALLAGLCKQWNLDPHVWQWRHGGRLSLSELLEALPTGGRQARLAKVVHRHALMINGRSTFGAEPGRHFGVGAEVYARFSAPMREVVGIFLHKELWEKLEGTAGGRDDDALRAEVVQVANRAKLQQKALTDDSNRLVLDQMFGGDLLRPEGDRPQRCATVMGLALGKVHLLLDEPPVDVKVYLRDLKRSLGTELSISKDGLELRKGRAGKALCRLGDAVLAHVVGRDTRRDRWMLSLRLA